ncbi:MAG: cyclic nucleotide-binding domain-containing protein [Gammaproteobacteria bacterium]|nr:cyclic nucleotide-binding domain-containing protein [Gammaproteobacteria bacterium]
MAENQSLFHDLSDVELADMQSCSIIKNFSANEIIFNEGDVLDSFYIIESGSVSIQIDKSGQSEQVCKLNKGDYFGEMAIFTKAKRTATAVTIGDAVLRCVTKDVFLSFIKSHPVIEEKINLVLAKRNEELSLKENLMGATGLNAKKLHVSIKGDPSLRESAFMRERYESVVDKMLPELQSSLQELLLNRCIYRLFINMNSGEVRTYSIFNPLNEDIHTANKLVSKSYIERHFPVISYEDKEKYIKRLFNFILTDELFKKIPDHFQNIFNKSNADWQAVTAEEIINVISKLSTLRSIECFYLRNISISIVQDAIRMQFNCDGTHIVSSEDYKQFLKDNVDE